MDESPSFAPEEDPFFVNIFKQLSRAEKLDTTGVSKTSGLKANFLESLKKSPIDVQKSEDIPKAEINSESMMKPNTKRTKKNKTILLEEPRCNPKRTTRTQNPQKLNEKMFDNFSESKEKDDDKTGANKSQRWGRAKDKNLFQLIREMEQEKILTFDELKTIEPRQAYRHKGVRLLAKRFGWKTIVRNLVSRIKNLQEKEFSVREIKLMKSIIKKEYRYKNVNYDKLIYHFPGKSMEDVVEFCDKIVNAKLNKCLGDVKYSQYQCKQ